MAPEHPMSSFHAHTAAALDGLRGVPLADLEPGALLGALVVVGDAVRLGIEVPPQVMRAAEALSENVFRAAFGALLDETSTWSLPTEPRPQAEEPGYEWSIRQRDEAESVVVAARRVLTPQGILLDGLEEARAFESVIRLLDFTCGGRRGREDAEQALGERIVLATPGSWLEQLPELVQGDTPGDVSEDRALESAMTTAPSDEYVDAYIARGELVRTVEGAALRSASFAEELEAMIEAGMACRSTVGIVARRWLRSRRASTGPLSLAVLPKLRLAAADEDANLATISETVELGTLAPLDAAASLRIGADEAILQIYPGLGVELVSVRFGSAVATSADQEGIWRLTARPTNVIVLRVEARDGRVFEETLQLEPTT